MRSEESTSPVVTLPACAVTVSAPSPMEKLTERLDTVLRRLDRLESGRREYSPGSGDMSSSSSGRRPIQCYNCGRPGHISRECRQSRRPRWSGNSGQQRSWVHDYYIYRATRRSLEGCLLAFLIRGAPRSRRHSQIVVDPDLPLEVVIRTLLKLHLVYVATSDLRTWATWKPTFFWQIYWRLVNPHNICVMRIARMKED